MELSVQSLYGLLIRSRLLSLADAQAMFKRWQDEASEDTANTARFAKWMVSNKYVTEYQASLLARGHTEGFFLGQYTILERLGRGRMAGVYRAVHQLGQMVAIKVLPPSKAKDAHLFGRFQRESRLATELKHPNIVATFQVGEANGVHYLVMEHLEGETLQDVLQRRGKLALEEAVRIVYQTLLGLQHLHEKGLVHRDLKPANLMIVSSSSAKNSDTTQGSTIKILDIGLARSEGDDAELADGAEGPLTTEGILLGTPDYMSPEQARNARSVDIRSDIYSLGCVLFHAIAGQPPFPDSNIISQMIRHSSEAPRALKEFNPVVPDGLQQIINWMMAKSPNERYRTPQRAALALQVFLVAGDAAEPQQESDPKLQSYLEWLEKKESATVDFVKPDRSDANATMRPARHSKSITPTQDGPILSALKPTATKSKAVGLQESSKAFSPKATEKVALLAKPVEGGESPQEVEVAVQSASLDFDVELIAPLAVKRKTSAPRTRGLRLTRRDFVMFAVGSITVLLALAIGKLLAGLFPKQRTPAPESQSDNPEPQ
jgi:serine/threonine protein kinase